MNKYQEALAGLKFSIDFYHKQSNTILNCEDTKFKILQELVDKEEKYKWHDLRKDPNDLPEINSIVVFAHLCIGEKIGYSLTKYDSNYILTKAEIAWKYEEFKDE